MHAPAVGDDQLGVVRLDHREPRADGEEVRRLLAEREREDSRADQRDRGALLPQGEDLAHAAMLLMSRNWHLTRVKSTASVRPRDPRPHPGDARAGLLRPGRPHRPAGRPARRGPAGRGPRPRLGVPLRAVQPQGRRRARRGGCGGHDPARHRHRGHQPQHPAPAGHRDDGHHAAPAQRRPLRARPRPRLRPALRRDGPAPRHRRPDRGRDRHLPQALARRGVRSRRAGRELPVPLPGQDASTRTSRC